MAGSNSAAIYARVSTKNHGQDPNTQLIPLRDYAAARGLGASPRSMWTWVCPAPRFPGALLDRLMADARRRQFATVLVARFDRFARSTRHLVLALEEFQALGIDFISLSESIDTSTPMGKMVFTVISAVAELERSLIRERVMMGLERAKGEGRGSGRPQPGHQAEAGREAAGRGYSIAASPSSSASRRAAWIACGRRRWDEGRRAG